MQMTTELADILRKLHRIIGEVELDSFSIIYPTTFLPNLPTMSPINKMFIVHPLIRLKRDKCLSIII